MNGHHERGSGGGDIIAICFAVLILIYLFGG